MPRRVAIAIALVLLLVGGGAGFAPAARASGYPALPAADQGRFLTNLSAPILAPGGSGAVTFTIADPLAGSMTSVVFRVEAYAFNALPGNATGVVPPDGAPTFSGGSPNGSSDAIRFASISPGTHLSAPGDVALTVAVPGSAPSGTYALRTSLAFRAAGQDYLLESRGFFSASQWDNATMLPNKTPTLNLSRLGVSGIVPETALLVETNAIAGWLYGLLGVSVVLAAAGGYVAWRRGSRSRSGARTTPPPQNARTAFGSRRSSVGD